MKNQIILLIFGIMICPAIFAQDLLYLLNDSSVVNKKKYSELTFKTTRIVIGQSIENTSKGDLLFSISHHFGKVNLGPNNFWGLDIATTRFGFDYGITKRLSIGIGRSTYLKNYDGSVKYKILRQYSGVQNMPVSVSYFGEANINSMQQNFPDGKNYFYTRLSYVSQLLIAHKFNNSLSLQLTPSYIHYNLVNLKTDQNNVFAIGIGGRFKITKRTSVNFEYHYLLPGQAAKDFDNSLSLGVDIETGGHVFQLFLTNSQPLFERGFIAETQGKWAKGDIYFGFNISRAFTLIPNYKSNQ